MPHESTFSRAFAEFAEAQLGQFTHETLIRETQAGRIIGHIARDSTAIQAREDFPETSQTEARQRATKEEPIGEALVEGPDVPLAQQKPETQGADGQNSYGTGSLSVEEILRKIPQLYSIGAKVGTQETSYSRGYKLHLDVVDGQIPVTASLTSANVHDARLAISVAKLTTARYLSIRTDGFGL